MANTKEKDYKSSVTLMIVGDAIEPTEISKLLCMTPSQSWRKGDRRVYKSGHVFTYKHGGWKMFAPDEERCLYVEQQILAWVARLQNKETEIDRILKDGALVVLDCYLASDGPIPLELSREIMLQVATLGLHISAHIFQDQSNEETVPHLDMV